MKPEHLVTMVTVIIISSCCSLNATLSKENSPIKRLIIFTGRSVSPQFHVAQRSRRETKIKERIVFAQRPNGEHSENEVGLHRRNDYVPSTQQPHISHLPLQQLTDTGGHGLLTKYQYHYYNPADRSYVHVEVQEPTILGRTATSYPTAFSYDDRYSTYTSGSADDPSEGSVGMDAASASSSHGGSSEDVATASYAVGYGAMTTTAAGDEGAGGSQTYPAEFAGYPTTYSAVAEEPSSEYVGQSTGYSGYIAAVPVDVTDYDTSNSQASAAATDYATGNPWASLTPTQNYYSSPSLMDFGSSRVGHLYMGPGGVSTATGYVGYGGTSDQQAARPGPTYRSRGPTTLRVLKNSQLLKLFPNRHVQTDKQNVANRS